MMFEFNTHQGQNMRMCGHTRKEDVTKLPTKCQIVKKLHSTESLPTSKQKDKRGCFRVKKKKFLEKLSSKPKPHEVRDFTYILILLTWSKSPQANIVS